MTNDVDVRENVVFGSGGGRELRCDIFTPAGGAKNAPALLLLHGGGWSAGDRRRMSNFALRFAQEGFVCIAPEYRLTGESPWPAQIEDVKTAIRWTRANCDGLGIDGGRIAALGSSAGAHLALLAAGTPGLPAFAGSGGNPAVDEALAAAIAIYPPVVFYTSGERPRGASPARSLLRDAADEETARQASPLSYVRPGFPPVFLLHGTADKEVPPSASMLMYETLVRAGVPAELHMYAGQPHGFAGQPEAIDLICAEGVHFLRRHLTAVKAGEAAEVSVTA